MKRLLELLTGALAALWLVGERGHLMLPSTRRFIAERGWRSLLTPGFWHGYIYGRWSNQYIGWSIKHYFPWIKPVAGARYWADDYHGKIVPTELARALISVNEPIRRADLEQIIPYAKARAIVLDGPPDVALYECACRAARDHPCQPTQVCMIVGQPFVDFVVEHHPDTARRVTRQEALAVIQAEHERGHIHAAYFKDVMFDRFYAICNCCACCCGGLEAMRRGVPMVTASGYVAQINADDCAACGTCADICPFDAIEINGHASVLFEKCMGCGVCEDQCAQGAIALALDARKGLPLDARQLPGGAR